MKKLNREKLDGNEKRIGIVISRFNEAVTSKLLEGCLKGLIENSVKEDNVSIYWVPGAFEIPFAAQRLAREKTYDAIICLGAVIRGETTHHELISQETARGIQKISLEYDIPVIFGVLTTENSEQAFERAGGKKGNKGYDAALAALELSNLF